MMEMFDLMMMLNFCFLSLILLFMIFKYMLIMLMMMEILIMMISLMIYYMFSMINLGGVLIYYLIFSVCESVLGLMILVLLIRYNGNEMYYSMNLFIFF